TGNYIVEMNVTVANANILLSTAVARVNSLGSCRLSAALPLSSPPEAPASKPSPLPASTWGPGPAATDSRSITDFGTPRPARSQSPFKLVPQAPRRWRHGL